MILRRCKECRRERKLDSLKCSCGAAKKDTFKAVVVVPGSGGKKRTKSSPNFKGAMLAEDELQDEVKASQAPLQVVPVVSTSLPYPSPSAHVPAQQQQAAPTFAEIWKSYSPYIELRKRSYKADLQRWRDYIKKPPGPKPADRIRPADIQAIVDGCIRKGEAASTTMQVFSLIRAMFNYADRLELTIGLPNPCRKVQVPKVDNKVTNPLPPEDFKKLLTACAAWENQHASLTSIPGHL